MKARLFFALFILIFASMACSLFSGTPTPTVPPPPTNTAAPVNSPVPTDTAAPEITDTPEVNKPLDVTPEPPGGGAISNLQDAEKAVIRIVSQVAVESPDLPVSVENVKGGSGFVIDPNGLAITNNHVVSGAALIEVYFSGNETPYQAKLLAVSECSDLALIQIQGENFPYFDWYTGDIKLGLRVYSMGYPLGDKEFSRHEGTVTKRTAPPHRTNWTDVNSVIEHDAIINPGSSGGPLVTEDGKVVGVNYSSIKGADQYYAITYKEVKPILDDMKEGKDVLALGINGEAFLTQKGFAGIWVYSVRSGSIADKTGIKSGDILTDMEGIQLAKNGTMQEYCGILRGHKPTDTLTVKVLRYKTQELLEGQFNGRVLSSGSGQSSNPGSDTQGNNQGNNNQGNTQGGEGAYFREEFAGDISAWKYQVLVGNEKNTRIERAAEQLSLTMNNPGTYVYVRNEKNSYKDVIVTTQVKNTGDNNMGVALICRYTERGWYEMRTHPNGTVEIFRYEKNLKDRGQVPFFRLSPSYSAVAMKGGNTTNTFGFGCVGNNLLIYINGQEIQPYGKIISDDMFTEGWVGIGGNSEGAKQYVRLEYEYVDIAKP